MVGGKDLGKTVVQRCNLVQPLSTIHKFWEEFEGKNKQRRDMLLPEKKLLRFRHIPPFHTVKS